MAAFEKGDRVAWDHQFSTPHAEGSIVRAEAVPETVKVGVVKSVENDAGTHFKVKFGKDEEAVLTADELVKVAGDE